MYEHTVTVVLKYSDADYGEELSEEDILKIVKDELNDGDLIYTHSEGVIKLEHRDDSTELSYSFQTLK